MVRLSLRFAFLFFLVLGIVISCKKDEVAPSIVQFSSPSLVALEFWGTQKIGINFSTPLQADITLTININDSTAVYGKDYTTFPDGISKTISVQIAKGSTSASFDFVPVAGTTIMPKRVVTFTLAGQYNNVQLGSSKSLHATLFDDASIVEFSNAILTTLEFGGTQKIGINFSSPLQSDITFKVNVNDSSAVYGKDYTTSPDGSSKTISIQIPKGAMSSSFDIIPIQGAVIVPNRAVRFTLGGQYNKIQFGVNANSRVTIVDDASIVQFSSPMVTALEFGGVQKIGINLSSALQSDVTLKVAIKDSTAVYGNDYTTSPSGSSKTVSIQIPKGSTTTSFDFIPVQTTQVMPKRVVNFTLGGQYNSVQLGHTTSMRATIVDDASVVQFVGTTMTLTELGGAKAVNLTFSTPLQADGNLSISVSDSTAIYGKDYTTTPDGSTKTISIPVVKGATHASFTLIPITNAGKIVNFSIKGLPLDVQLGSVPKLSATMLDDDLVCYLPMNGNAIDASHAANTTLVEGATLATGRKSLPNTAYQMDGISNDIVVTNSKVLDTIKYITMTAWIKPVSFAGIGNDAIVEKAFTSHTNPFYQYKLGITGDQHLNTPGSFLFTLSINGNYQYVASNAGTWTPGNWYFVVGTYDGNKMVLYVNGTQVASMPMSGNINHFGTNVFIGKLNNLSEFTPGTFGDIRIYNRALSSTEVSTLYLK